MNRRSFITWNLAGGFLWATLWLGGGYWFGQDLGSAESIFKAIALFGAITFISLIGIYYVKHKAEFKDAEVQKEVLDDKYE